jgi:hypothetical protein
MQGLGRHGFSENNQTRFWNNLHKKLKVNTYECEKRMHEFTLCIPFGTMLVTHRQRGRRGRDRKVGGFTTTCVISVYRH